MYISKKLLTAAAVVVIGISFWLGNYTHDFLASLRYFGAFVKSTADIPPGSMPSDALTPEAAGKAEPVPVGPGKVTAITDDSITLQIGFNETRTFSITPSIDVYSVVPEGQKGRTISDIQTGGTMTVYATKAEPKKARALAFPRDLSLVLTPQQVSSSITGKVLAVSSSTLTVAPVSGSAPVTIALDPVPTIVTTVKGGEVGRSIVVGDIVGASGLVTNGSKTTAKLIVIAPKAQ